MTDLLFWPFVLFLIFADFHLWHVLMAKDIPADFHVSVKALIFRVFCVTMASISAFMQKEFRNRVAATFLSILFVPAIILYFAIQYKLYGLNDELLKPPISPRDTGLSALYFSVITFTTTGYGDITPGSIACRAVAALEACMGYGFGAFLIASFIDLLGRVRLLREDKTNF